MQGGEHLTDRLAVVIRGCDAFAAASRLRTAARGKGMVLGKCGGDGQRCDAVAR
jgi:hypothetical protein